MRPTVTRIVEPAQSGPEWRARYRVEGGELAPAWASAVRPGNVAWCEISVYPDGVVGSYGGEVWPSAWPELFELRGPGTAQLPKWTVITDVFRALVGA